MAHASPPAPSPHLLFTSTEGGYNRLHLALEGPEGRADESGCAGVLARGLAAYDPVRDLTVSTVQHHSGFLDEVTKVLVERQPPVERLRLGALTFPDYERADEPSETGDGGAWCLDGPNIGAVVAALPTLTDLTVQANTITVHDAVTAPCLARLLLRMDRIDAYQVHEGWDALAEWRCPALEDLEIWPGNFGLGWGASDASVLTPLLQSRRLPALRRLRILTDLADDVVRVLAEGPLLGQLTVLDLSDSTLSDRGAEMLLTRWEQFAHLERLELGGNCLSGEAATMLEERAPEAVSVGTQRWSRGHRFCAPRPVSLFQRWERGPDELRYR